MQHPIGDSFWVKSATTKPPNSRYSLTSRLTGLQFSPTEKASRIKRISGVEAANRQQLNYRNIKHAKLQVCQEVLLNNPTTSMLDCTLESVRVERNLESMRVEKTLESIRVERTTECENRDEWNIYRLRPLDVRSEHSVGQWSPPLFQYVFEDLLAYAPPPMSLAAPQSGWPVTTRNGRTVRPVEQNTLIFSYIHTILPNCKYLFQGGRYVIDQ